MPFPLTTALEWLRGDRLDTVCVGEFVIAFGFGSGGAVQSEAIVALSDGGDWTAYDPKTRDGIWQFQRLIGAEVATIERTDNRLDLGFKDGLTLRLRIASGMAESGQISAPGGAAFFY